MECGVVHGGKSFQNFKRNMWPGEVEGALRD